MRSLVRTRRRNGDFQERRAQRARMGASDALQVNDEDEEQVPEGGASETTTTPIHAHAYTPATPHVHAQAKRVYMRGRRMQQTPSLVDDANEPIPLRSRQGRGCSVARA